ncbi:MAG: 4a-hydroxytetrahydrobiopterin dehydratase, partial [Methylococcales bacterium]
RLKQVFRFNNFIEAMVFTQKVADLAEDENHHPAIVTEWGKVTVCWWSHKIKGLHVNDFIMAAKTDSL